MKQLRRIRVIFLPVLLALFVGHTGTATEESTGGYIDDTVLLHEATQAGPPSTSPAAQLVSPSPRQQNRGMQIANA